MIIQWAYALKLPWGPVLLFAYFILVCALVFDLNRAYRITVGKPPQPPLPPGLFPPATPGLSKNPRERAGGRWRNGLIVGFVALVVAPSMLSGPLRGDYGSAVMLTAAAGLAAALALSKLCEVRGWRIAEHGLMAIAAACLAGMMLHRYWLTGDEGLRHYLVIVGLLAAILTLLGLSYGLMRCFPPPTTTARAHVRFVLGLILCGLLAAVFFVRI